MKRQPARIRMMAYAIWLLCTAVGAADGPQPAGKSGPVLERAGGDWPCWRGPFGNGTAASCGKALVDSPSQAKLVWKSDEKIPNSYVADHRSKGDFDVMGGGFAAPVVADGKVYQYYYAPSGTAFCACHPNVRKFLTDADDVIHCFDARTGKTLWKAVFKEKGINITGGFNKGGGLLTPCVAQGKVYAVGSAAKVYCVDAQTGKALWESDLGQRAKDMENDRRKAKENKGPPYFNRDMGGSVAFADGVLVCNDAAEYYTKRNKVGNGLIAFDGEKGTVLWKLAECADWHSCPVRWTHKAKDYIIIGNRAKVTCLEPRTGKVLWSETQATSYVAVAADQDHLICTGRGGSGMICFRITPQGAQELWSLPEGYGSCSPVICKSHVYVQSKKLVCVELETGKVAASLPGNDVYSSLVGGDGLLFLPGKSSSGTGFLMYKTDPNDFRVLGGPLGDNYASSTTPAFADGFLYFRGADRLCCYDLRKAPIGTAKGDLR